MTRKDRKNRLFPELDELECGCIIGGGRESGEAIPPEGESGTVSPPTGRTASSAANSAAHSHPSDCPCVRLHERIRELEAENAKWRKDWFEVYEPLLAKETHCCVKTRNGEYWALQKALHARDERSPPRP